MNTRRHTLSRLTATAVAIALCAAMHVSMLQATDNPVPAYGAEDDQAVGAYESYRQVIAATAAMVGDQDVHELAAKHGLNVLNVTWEDTGRFKDSAVGPNISDMTIQIQQMDPSTEEYALTCMPVIRYPNFSDVTADIAPEDFLLLVGNEKGEPLMPISLRQLLADPRQYLTDADSWAGDNMTLLAKRDTHVLVSAQACFLPIPADGLATFNPVVFNYQSYEGDPAVLTILVTREGTSMTVIDNKRDAFPAGWSWGQRLFFNNGGERASLTGRRMSDHLADDRPGESDSDQTPQAAGQEGLNMVLLIQVPLKQQNPLRSDWEGEAGESGGSDQLLDETASASSDVEAAVIGHGEIEGPFTEIDNLPIVRDPDYPVRVTVQFYKATSNGVVNESDMAAIAEQIQRVYKEADYIGSLVVDGRTNRPTEHDGPQFEPPDWWEAFWQRHQENTGLTPEETIRMLRKLYGPNYVPADEQELLRELEKLQEDT